MSVYKKKLQRANSENTSVHTYSDDPQSRGSEERGEI